jgi:formamidopyrimidine-DNA glycosylase
MPELPEVETVRLQLEREILGSTIAVVEINEAKNFVGDKALIIGEKIGKVGRVGKYLFVHFESDKGLVIHLKMTGRLVLQDDFYDSAKHTRVIITLSDGRKVYYWDIRKFGYVRVENNLQLSISNLQKKMGKEPWDISDKDLLGKLKKTTRPIKEAILDQSILAGVGNIYANDGLWLAGIDPRRKSNSIKLNEIKKLRESLCIVLKRGLAVGGASDNTYRDFYGERGSYQDEFLTYGRTGEPCNKCGTKLKRIVVGGRGSWICEKCQK